MKDIPGFLLLVLDNGKMNFYKNNTPSRTTESNQKVMYTPTTAEIEKYKIFFFMEMILQNRSVSTSTKKEKEKKPKHFIHFYLFIFRHLQKKSCYLL